MLRGASEREGVHEGCVIDCRTLVSGETDGSADGVGEAVQVTPVLDAGVQCGESDQTEVGREPTSVDAFKGRAVGLQGDPAAQWWAELADGGCRQDAALAVGGEN